MVDNTNVMTNRVLFIGIGHCGNKIANEFYKLGYNSVYLNSSYEDLMLIDAPDNTKFALPAEGCGGDRDYAFSLVAQEHKNIEKDIMSRYSKYEYIYIIFSGCGGTGSGTGPAFAQYLANRYSADRSEEERVADGNLPNKTIGIMMALPDEEDGEDNIVNCINCYNDVMDRCPDVKNIFLIDNSFMNKYNINKVFAESVDKLFSVTKADNRTVIDPTDLGKLLKVRGCVYMSEIYSHGEGVYDIRDSRVLAKFVRGCEYIVTSLKDDKDFDRDNLAGHFGEPAGFIKGYNNWSKSYAFVFGMTYPNEWYERALRWQENIIERRKKDLENMPTFSFKRVNTSSTRNILDMGIKKVESNPFGTSAKEVFSKSKNIFDKFDNKKK